FLAEMLGGMLFLVWLYRSMGRPVSTPETRSLRKIIKIAACVGLAVAVRDFTSNILGYVTFADLVGNALFLSAYLALILYAVIEVLEGLVMIALRLRPFSLFSIVRRHGPLLRRRVRHGLVWLDSFPWLVVARNRLLLRDQSVSAIREILTAEFIVGSLRVSLRDVLAFFFSSRRRHTILVSDWSSDVCSSD